jgi:hypothetical protein
MLEKIAAAATQEPGLAHVSKDVRRLARTTCIESPKVTN